MNAMTDLGIIDYSYKEEYDKIQGIFIYTLHFLLLHTNRMYSTRGAAFSPTQCHEQAMGYMAQVVREAVRA
jgi:hypothetical protein